MSRRWTLVVLLVAAAVAGPVSVAGRSSENEAPLADAGLDQHVQQGTTVLLDATGSRDPDGEITSYEWRIETPGGTTVAPACPTCGRTRFQPARAGTYAVTVTVTDDDGVQSSDTLYVYVGETNEADTSSATVPSSGSSSPSEGAVSSGPSDSPGPPTTGNPPGVDPGNTAQTSCSSGNCPGSSGVEPWLEIEGPTRAAPGEPVRFDLSYGGFDGTPQFGWSTAISGTGGTVSWNSPGSETLYVTGLAGSQTAHDHHDVRVAENQDPIVAIHTPDELHPGETVTLSAEVSDPDGWIVSREWENGPVVEVPESGERGVLLRAKDNDGAVTTDRVSISVDGVDANLAQDSTSIHTVYCYYHKESQRKRQSPDHCEIEGSDNSGDFDGYQTATSDLDRMLRLPYYNVVWKKTEQEIQQHSGDISDDTGIQMPDVVDNDGSTLTLPSLTADQKDAIAGRAATTDSQSFSMNGNTVQNDLNGDGDVNAEDWDDRFGTSEPTVTENHRDAVSELKDAQQSLWRARFHSGAGTGGSDRSDSGDEPDHQSAPGGNQAEGSRADSTAGGGTSVADSTDPASSHTSSGQHAARKGRRVADGGFNPGGGMY